MTAKRTFLREWLWYLPCVAFLAVVLGVRQLTGHGWADLYVPRDALLGGIVLYGQLCVARLAASSLRAAKKR